MGLHRLLLFLACVSILPHPLRQRWLLAQAQYNQETTTGFYSPHGPNGPARRVELWTADPFAARPEPVINLAPELVVLEYNCYYMRDICKNADNWFATARGQAHRIRNGYRFAFDFDKVGPQNTWHNQRRRTASCGNFRNTVTCPHIDQGIVMRHDGPWQHKDLEPGTTINEIRAKTQGGQRQGSYVRYTCDEFPPATWIEGGNGLAGLSYDRSETRCAAFRCDGSRGVKAEQNWQGTSHAVLRRTLQSRITARNRPPTPPEFPWFGPKGSVAFFELRYNRITNFPNGVAAKVIVYSTPGGAVFDSKDIRQQKRDPGAPANRTIVGTSQLDREAFWRWANNVTVDELLAMGPAHVSEMHVVANHTEAAMQSPEAFGGTGMSWMGFSEEYDDEQDKARARPPPPDVVSGPPRADPNKVRKRQESSSATPPLLRNASSSDLERARQIVEDAIVKSAELNAARLASPARNRYRLKPGTDLGGSTLRRPAEEGGDDATAPPPLLDITDEIAAAAALVSEADALGDGAFAGNISARHIRDRPKRQVKAAASGTFWMEHIERKGTVPFGDDPSYKVFRNVLDYGAKGDGVADDTKAIKEAMNSGKRCGAKCNGSTTKNAIVYFPPGTYRVSSTIPMPFGTQVIGDANDWPTLLATRTFIGLGVLSANEYTGGGKGTDGLDQQWYVNTGNFYRQIRNIKIDITQTRPVQEVAGLHYQVAQATSLQNVEIIALSGSTQRGIFAENGSGGVISDVTFRGGKFGLYGGNQQFTAQRLTFVGCDTGVQVIWDWGWVWKSITMTDVGVGFRLLQEAKTSTVKRQTDPNKEAAGNIGSASFLDSTFRNVQTVVLIAPPNEKPGSGSTGVIVENVKVEGVGKVVADTGGATLLAAPASGKVDHWALGPVLRESGKPEFVRGAKVGSFRRQPDLLDSNGAYFERAKPQYQNRPVGDFVHVKDFGAKGDGVSDDTAAFQQALYESQGRILFVDAGSYIITGTITVPVNSRIVGETWSQLVAAGSYFENANEPKVMLQVGHDGSVGDIEMQDLIFTSRGPTAGLILVQWNILAATPGSAALWDCHVRIGGATGTGLTPAECPALRSGVAPGCNAASLMMHITPRASGYFENMWLWVADHMIDDPDLVDANNTMVQNSVYVARGLLVESVKPTWLYGTSSEHAVFYQYNFHKAKNIFAGMIQTESPYYQPTPPPPAPFEGAVGKLPGDPDYKCTSGDEFSGCDESWAVIMRECSQIFVAGAGLYSWFSTYTQDCIDAHSCQKVLMLLEDNHAGVRFQHIITIGAKYVAVMDGKAIDALDYLNVESHPRWSQMSVLDVASDGKGAELLWIDPKIWDMEQPAFTCSPPCLVNIPPWTHATRIVDFPRITVTQDGWSTTITRPPLTITQMHFEVVTLTEAAAAAGRNRKRSAQGFSPFWPVPATTPRWPLVTYTDPAGNVFETAPTVPFPTPPASIGPDLPPPVAGGHWPRQLLRPEPGLEEQPFYDKCWYNGSWDPDCANGGWGSDIGGDIGEMPDSPFEPQDEDYGEADVICPEPTSTTSTTTAATMTTKEPDKPTESPLETGHPEKNQQPHCYGNGQPANNAQLSAARRSFCNSEINGIGTAQGGLIINPRGSQANVVRSHEYEPNANGQWPIKIIVSLEIKPGCQFKVDASQCDRYLQVPVDSCDCAGADKKYGGHIENDCYIWRIDPEWKR